MLDDHIKLLPEDHESAILVGRIWTPANEYYPAGPSIVRVSASEVFDLTANIATLTQLINRKDALEYLASLTAAKPVATFETIARNTLSDKRNPEQPHFISPVDLQPVKACGVTFHDSLVERLIEERSEGNKDLAYRVRKELSEKLGVDIGSVVPGSSQALELLTLLIKLESLL